jgi:hypothetical protein
MRTALERAVLAAAASTAATTSTYVFTYVHADPISPEKEAAEKLSEKEEKKHMPAVRAPIKMNENVVCEEKGKGGKGSMRKVGLDVIYDAGSTGSRMYAFYSDINTGALIKSRIVAKKKPGVSLKNTRRTLTVGDYDSEEKDVCDMTDNNIRISIITKI